MSSIGRVVLYVDSPDPKGQRVVRPAFVIAVGADHTTCDLQVFTGAGSPFFKKAVPFGDATYTPGTWQWTDVR
jgi:hypothetical protein